MTLEQAEEKQVELPLHITCPKCGHADRAKAPLDWFIGKILLGEIINDLTAIKARLGILSGNKPVEPKPDMQVQPKGTKPKVKLKGRGTATKERLVCASCYDKNESYQPDEVRVQEEEEALYQICADCGTTEHADMLKLVWNK